MRYRAVLSMTACFAVACSGDDDGSAGPLGVVSDLFDVSPEPDVYYSEGYSVPAPGLEQYPQATASTLQVAGHLEGQLRDIRLSGDTTENFGSVDSWPEGGYLGMNVALQTPAGAAMIILSFSGGLDHPVFLEGQWTSQRELAAQLEPSYTGQQAISVTSCAGPTLGEYPYEQTAIDYDMTVETDPLDPSTVVVAVGASFYVDEQSNVSSEVAATVRFVRPE